MKKIVCEECLQEFDEAWEAKEHEAKCLEGWDPNTRITYYIVDYDA